MNRETSIRIRGVDRSAYANDHVKNDLARTLQLAHAHSSSAKLVSQLQHLFPVSQACWYMQMPFGQGRFGLDLKASSHVLFWLVFEHHSC
jgi:hypothetical protein